MAARAFKAVAQFGTDAFVSAEEIANTPSRQEGISEGDEARLRAYGCELIQSGCVLLKLPQVAALSGQMLFHRFYHKASFQHYDVEISAMSALFLASKREECAPFRKVKDFINVWDNMRKRREGKTGKELAAINPFSEEFKDLKDRMITTERSMLKKLGFILFVEHPHKFIVMYLQQLGLWNLSQTAWNYCNDSFRSTLCCRYAAEVIACAALLLACRGEGIRLPSQPCVWRFFGTKKEDVESVANEIAALYTMPKAANVEGIYIKKPTRREIKEKQAKEAAAKKAEEDAAAAAAKAEEDEARKAKEAEERKERGGKDDKKRSRRDRDQYSDSYSDSEDRSSRRDRGRGRSRSPRRRSRSRSHSRGRRGGDRRDSRGRDRGGYDRRDDRRSDRRDRRR